MDSKTEVAGPHPAIARICNEDPVSRVELQAQAAIRSVQTLAGMRVPITQRRELLLQVRNEIDRLLGDSYAASQVKSNR